MIASLLIYFLSTFRGVTAETLVLFGIALVFLFSSLLALLEYIASEQALQQVVFWTLVLRFINNVQVMLPPVGS